MKSIILISAAALLFSCGPNDGGSSGGTDSPKPPIDTTLVDTPSVPVDTPAAVQPTILLDFDGHKLVNTNWNNAGDTVGYLLGESGIDSSQIKSIEREVQEAFAQFGIAVTTSEQRYVTAPIGKRIRVVLTKSHEWYGNKAGGVAFMNAFLSAMADPCFVFTDLIKYNVNRAAKNAIHEAGHTLGLHHQAAFNESCVNEGEYYEGVGSEAPFMGFVPAERKGKWWIGPIPFGCQYIQNDTALIGKNLRSNKLRAPSLKPIED